MKDYYDLEPVEWGNLIVEENDKNLKRRKNETNENEAKRQPKPNV